MRLQKESHMNEPMHTQATEGDLMLLASVVLKIQDLAPNVLIGNVTVLRNSQ